MNALDRNPPAQPAHIEVEFQRLKRELSPSGIVSEVVKDDRRSYRWEFTNPMGVAVVWTLSRVYVISSLGSIDQDRSCLDVSRLRRWIQRSL